MSKPFYLVTRDLHLYLGLFISPFVLLFAISDFFLVHSWIPGAAGNRDVSTALVSNLKLPPDLDRLSGRPLVDALHPLLDQLGVHGEVQNVRRFPREHRLDIPVTVPGRETSVVIDLDSHSAQIKRRTTGVWDAMAVLHKAPGPHLTAIRMNWFMFRVWRWLADATAYLMLFISVSGIYLWAVLRAERRAGLILLAAGAFSFFGIVYVLSS
jgi:hypothetical protein